MQPIEMYTTQTNDGVYHGTVRISNSSPNSFVHYIDFEAAAKSRSDVEICMYEILCELKDSVKDAIDCISKSARQSTSRKIMQKKRATRGEMQHVTRMMLLRNGDYEHVCDIGSILPNICKGGRMHVNGQAFATIDSFYTTVDIEKSTIMQTILLKEE